MSGHFGHKPINSRYHSESEPAIGGIEQQQCVVVAAQTAAEGGTQARLKARRAQRRRARARLRRRRHHARRAARLAALQLPDNNIAML